MEEKAKAAPDKAKLIELAEVIQSISFPELKSEEGHKILADVKELLSQASYFIMTKTSDF